MPDSSSLLLKLYKIMLRLRVADEAIAEHYTQQEMRCPMHLGIGQEAISAGAAAALESQDCLFATHRSHGPYIASGGDLYAMFAEMYGKADGCCAGRGGSMHLVAMDKGFWGSIPIVGAAIPIATGAALAFNMRQERRVSMMILGDAATEEGVFHESIQYAVLKQLPVVYICENNRFSVNTPFIERRPKNFSIRELAKAHGLRTYGGFGNDVITVHQHCLEAVQLARNGGGPSFLEFETYRWKEHCGPYDDHHLSCRSTQDFDRWKKQCPLSRAEQQLLAENSIDQDRIHTMRNHEKAFVEEIMHRVKIASFPEQNEAYHNVYVSDTVYA